MSQYEDLVDHYGRPEPVPPRRALEVLGVQADPETVQAQKFYSPEMAEAFLAGAQSAGNFLGQAEDPAEPGTYIAAWTVSSAGASTLAARNRVV